MCLVDVIDVSYKPFGGDKGVQLDGWLIHLLG